MTNLLLSPRLIALDSAHYIQLIRDTNASNSTAIRQAKNFQEELTTKGYVPFFTFSHVAELLKYRDVSTVRNRVAFFQKLPAVAWTAKFEIPEMLGSPADVFAAEVTAAAAHPEMSVFDIRVAARKKVIKFGSGQDLMKPFLGEWQALQPHLIESERKNREIMALAGSKYLSNEQRRFDEFEKIQINSAQDSRRYLAEMQQMVGKDVKKYADKKLDRSEFINEFFQEITSLGDELRNNENPTKRFLEYFGIEKEHLVGISSVDALGELATFFKQLELAARITGTDIVTLKKSASIKAIPSWIIQSLLRKHRDRELRRDGSELVDRHLACLAAYADITFVDKRTKENARRVTMKDPNFPRLVNRIEQAGVYTQVISCLL